MKIFLLIFFISAILQVGEKEKQTVDSIVYLEGVTVSARKPMFTLKPNSRKESIHVRGKGKTALISKVVVDKDKKYKINAVEFFFNYKWQDIENEGFYIKPLLISAVDGKPAVEYLHSKILYFVSKKIDKVIYIDLSKFNIEIEKVNAFFVGLEFVDAKGNSLYEDFNVTMLPVRKKKYSSYIKGNCSRCVFTPFDLDEKTGLSLKYTIYYE